MLSGLLSTLPCTAVSCLTHDAAVRSEVAPHSTCLPVCCLNTPRCALPACCAGIVEELSEKGVSEVSEGATCVFIPGKDVPLIVQKSDGGFGYASTDMAALKQRITQEKADWIIYVTDVGQAGHFDLVFAAGRRVGWLPEEGSHQVRGG